MREPAPLVGAVGPSPRGTYHHGDLRNGFMEAALLLVGERGVHGFSLRQAARGLGVSPSAAYRHFADKEALLGAVAAEGSARMATAMREAGDGASLPGDMHGTAIVARLWAYAGAMIEFAVANPAYFRVMAAG